MSHTTSAKTVVICETQPVTVEGIRAMLDDCSDLKLVGAASSLLGGMELVRTNGPSIIIIDKAFGVQAVMDWIVSIRSQQRSTAPVIWGVSMNEAEALRMVQAGARGVIRKTADLSSLLTCLRTVSAGNTWMEDSMFAESEKARGTRSNLTAREQQVVELVEQGLKNKDIARSLGIRPGTVKIHLKHVFEKTGVRGRYGLALSGLKEKGLLSLSTM